MIKTKVFPLVLGILMISGIQNSFSEEYYYTTLDDGKNFYLRGDPVTICDFEVNDKNLPKAGRQLMMFTQESVFEWEKKLKDTTNQPNKWDFEYVPVNVAEQPTFDDSNCHVIVTYHREPPEEYRFEDLGITDYFWEQDNNFYFADIEIYYTAIGFEKSQEESANNGKLETITQFTPTYYENQLASDIKETIRHELGHALGLDHVNVDEDDFELIDGTYFSPSVMVEPDKTSLENQRYQITPYDIRAVVNLYGEDGFAETQNDIFFSQNFIIGFLIIAVIVGIIVLIIKFRVKKTKSIKN